jgi:hypothetical protein
LIFQQADAKEVGKAPKKDDKAAKKGLGFYI